MVANKAKLNDLIKKNDIQFVIPVYQRNYDWTIKECKVLLNDIKDAGKLNREHFIGSIVYVDDHTPKTGIQELIIVDGQQRLTTIILIYLRLYKLAEELKDNRLRDRMYEHYLINKYANTEEEKIKLKPTENNDKALKSIFSNNDFKEKSNIIDNYNFFEKEINSYNYKSILDGLEKLIFVDMSLDGKEDDPQRIFESLNSTGLALSQGDLIRNYILMKLNSKEQKYIYENYWEHIEKNARDETLNKDIVSDFIRDFITSKDNKIPNKNRVYEEFKLKYSINNINEIKEYLEELKEYSIYYNKLINPENEKDKEISLKLYDIKSIEVNVSYPFFLNIYKDYNDKVIDKNTFINIINLIESFVFRRFICDIKTSQLNKIFAALYKQIKKGKDYYNSLEMYLFKFKFPNDNEIKNNLKDKDIYKDKNQQRKMYLFRKLEKGNSKEIVSFNDTNYTIEHIFPQQPTKEWKKKLSKEDYKYMENKLHTIANLTISANNGELGNKTFSEKKNMNVDNKEQGYKYSRLWLNEYLKTIDEWNIERIEERFNILSERFINIWKYPNIKIDNMINCEIDIFEADDPTGKKLEYIIFNGEKINITDVSKLFSYIVKYYYDLNPNFFFTDEMLNLIKITKNKNELRSEYPIEIDDIYFAENNYSSERKFYLITYIMKKIDMEDELYIKYKD
ncbi:hypothetical protein A9X84_09900 [Brachyspira hyodysenteriae]|uniref:DUF262 domain-containing protein n=1 Tax=Brachyspira hyodysenteriae TaxID=159 RepID=UPI00063DA1B1|nr:DUF262 domain-containing protein [Brachyspira hyodysenteriae]KLI21400.1 hypothetical protein SR30_12345 [Brachyspira hyodysenteriae]QTM08827.1 DUF262 domain-containing protein [Brachyspira hyodysenteriae]TVL43269.1 hypothetical protein A9X84_09900 [Brachyspira hyodysenteriae]TVL44949.1 hypothetical protein A9X73_11490 [Brachyspira hyodysenteriae]TVL74925.1 hypothetical protein A9X77_10805 [Brachyspira hyodysenteriae]